MPQFHDAIQQVLNAHNLLKMYLFLQLPLEFDSQFENQVQRFYSQVLKNQFVLIPHHCLKNFHNLL